MTPRKRLAIFYAGKEFAIADRTLDEVAGEIEAAMTSGEPAWLEARVGQGRSASVRLLLMPGIPIAVGDIPTDGSPTPTEPHPEREGEAMTDVAAAES